MYFHGISWNFDDFQRLFRYLNNEISIILNLYAAGVTLLSDKRIFIFFSRWKKYSPGVTCMFWSGSQMARNFQPEVVFRMFSIAKPTVRLSKDFAGFEARKISKPCCHPRRKVDPEILFYFIRFISCPSVPHPVQIFGKHFRGPGDSKNLQKTRCFLWNSSGFHSVSLVFPVRTYLVQPTRLPGGLLEGGILSNPVF